MRRGALKTPDEDVAGVVTGSTRITSRTTLGEQTVLRAKYGVDRLTYEYGIGLLKPVFAILVAGEITARGRGDTEAEALDDAFARLRMRSETKIWREIFFDHFFEVFFHVTSDFKLKGGRIVKLFPGHWADIQAELEVVPTPVGQPCVGCGQRFSPSDRGLFVPHVGEVGDRVAELPWHQDCFLHAVGLDDA